MDFLQQLKLRNLFNNQQQNPNPIQATMPAVNPANMMIPRQEPPPSIISPADSPDTGLEALRGRATPAINEYKKFLEDQPTRQDNKLSKLGKILAMTAGTVEGGISKDVGRGIKTGMGIVDAPYERAKDDWSMKGGRLKEMAELEYRGLTDDQKLEVQIAKNDLEQQETYIKMLQANSTIALNSQKAKEIADKIKNSGKNLVKNESTGDMEIVDSKTGERQSLGRFLETAGEKRTEEFGFFKKREEIEQSGRIGLENVRHRGSMQLEGARQEGDIATEKLRQTGATGLETQRQTGRERLARVTGEITSIAKAKDVKLNLLSPTQQNAAFQGALGRSLLEHPEWRRELFEIDDATGQLVPKEHASENDSYAVFLADVVSKTRDVTGAGDTKVNDPSIPVPKSQTLVPGISGTGGGNKTSIPNFLRPEMQPSITPPPGPPTVALPNLTPPPPYNSTQGTGNIIPNMPAPTINPAGMQGNVQSDNPSDTAAIAALAKIGFPNPTPEMIAEAKKDLGLP